MSETVVTECLALVAVDEISKYIPYREIGRQNMNFQGRRGEVSFELRRDYCAIVVDRNRDVSRRSCNLPYLSGKGEDVFPI
jgi:hypothetical protein